MKMHILLLIIITAAISVLPACSAVPMTAATATPPPTRLPTQTETLRPSETTTPSNTPLPTATATLPSTSTPSLTMTATPRPIFAGFQVEFVQYAYYGMQFAFFIPGIKLNYRLLANALPFKCSLYDQYPNKLYCIGPAIAPNTDVQLSFLPQTGSDTPVFEATYKLGSMITPTIDIRTLKASNPTNCPQHGVNISCETEYRKNEGGCCVVATCVDACGYYFSVDTCPVEMEMQGICEGTPPIPYPKK